MPPDKTCTALTRVLALATLTVVSAVMLSCTATRGRWADGWYSEQLLLKGAGSSKKLELRYHPGELGSSWLESPSAAGDVAFYSEDLGATIYADSSCGARYEDAPLPVLLNHLLFGFTEVQLNDERDSLLAGRASLTREATARLDGVQVEVSATVTKNGPCVFDLVFIGPPGSLQEGHSHYETFLSGLAVEYRP